MAPHEVRTIESSYPAFDEGVEGEQDKHLLIYRDQLGQWSASLYYTFIDGQLKQARYAIFAVNDLTDAFEFFDSLLTKKYGKPTKSTGLSQVSKLDEIAEAGADPNPPVSKTWETSSTRIILLADFTKSKHIGMDEASMTAVITINYFDIDYKNYDRPTLKKLEE